ncbi:MAG: PEP-CTERM sorting domain-containing protein [Candidatus Parcubacteria bacterium]|nr:PEP-CTERM sorting domain-containing protein [Phormidesmis priestleyi]MBC7823915.1 PEP-CTERM sorting domain-containing protein [Leptolyngbyaceae cyanobacterium LF-bin-113]
MFKADGAELKGFVPLTKVPEPAAAIGPALVAVGVFGLRRKSSVQ